MKQKAPRLSLEVRGTSPSMRTTFWLVQRPQSEWVAVARRSVRSTAPLWLKSELSDSKLRSSP